ncbi:rab11 family-interacting protein 4-like isoform X1 [Daphnia pulicaria]|uniref:rab11 family-interacting protein 4-like isoform X1 n=1 Tax=Daphnia pulicaria TaxID=35523 RepID=UPI001EEA5A38|nr:rab11 family-interacting protein 4-like isoform X1 [Daphnia pulicaria]
MEAPLCDRQQQVNLNNNINNSKDVDVHQQLLRRVFQMCDVQRRGHISIDDLLELGQSYLGQDTKDLADALRSLDPLGDGTLTFDEFCRGVGSIIQQSPTEGPTSRDLTSSTSSSSPTKRSRTLIDWSELTMPLVTGEGHSTSTQAAHLVVNDEDILLASSVDGSVVAGKRRNSLSDEVDSGYSKSSSPTDSAPTTGSVSGCSSMSEREISFEGYGEADHSIENGTPSDADANPVPQMIGNRANWMNGMLRNSLRRSDYNSHGDGAFHRRYGSLRLPGKRGIAAGSNALASQLYSKNVNNTSSRSSNGGDNEDFCSDASLEDDVVDLGHKVQILQQQITALADTQFSSDDRYSRSKQENAALTARLQMLEESLRDVELRATQQLSEEQRRNKELIVRVEREKQLEIENCTIKLQAAEREVELTREECARLRGQTERLRGERSALQQRLYEAESSLLEGQEELRRMSDLVKREREQWAVENANGKQLAAELSREVDLLRATQHQSSNSSSHGEFGEELTPSAARVREMENEIKTLKQQNNSLREANDELQAQLFSRGLEEGRTLLSEHVACNSLAAEFEVMSQDDVSEKIRTALKEQQDVNAQLRSYIEGILLTIVENQPSLLERKPLP